MLFATKYKSAKKKSQTQTQVNDLSKRCSAERPLNPEQGGCNGVFDNLVMTIGVGIDPKGNNSCQVKLSSGLFVWSSRTMTKLSKSNAQAPMDKNQFKYLFCMFELVYHLMICGHAISNGLPF